MAYNNVMLRFNREILKQHRQNQNRHINDRMDTFVDKVREEIVVKKTRMEINGYDCEKMTVEAYARAHGYQFYYDGKYVRGVSNAITRPELNGQGCALDTRFD